MAESVYWRQFVGYLIGVRLASPLTPMTYRSRWNALEASFGIPFTEDIRHRLTPMMFLEWLAGNAHRAPETRKGFLTAVKAWERFGAIVGWWPTPSGLVNIVLPVPESEPSPPLPVRKVRAILDACETPKEHRLVYLGLYEGLRIAESESLRDDAWHDDRLEFVGKYRKRRQVPLHPEVMRVAGIIRAGPQPKPQSLKYVCVKLREKVGFHFETHDLRRTFGDTLLDVGAAWEIVEAVLGHSLGVTGRYARPSFVRKRDAVWMVNYGRGLADGHAAAAGVV